VVQTYYTYHIRIANSNNVQVQKLDPNDKDLGQPYGRFGYKGKTRIRIQALHLAAHRGELADQEVQELGEKLFTALFDPVLRRDFFVLYEQVLHERALLRLELDVDERELPEVASLPWEFMCVPPGEDYGAVWLGTDPNLIFSRRRANWKIPEPILLKEGECLRIALVVAAPGRLSYVVYDKIWQGLQNLAREQKDRFELLDLVESATLLEIDKVLERKPHIFHFIGHAELKKENQRDIAQIALVDETSADDPDWIGAERFSGLFRRYRPGIVILQACEGGSLSASEAFVGVASYIVQQNIPVVVAMQYEVSNVTAQRFALEFYKRLAQNDPVDKAAQEGRRRISLAPTGQNERDFATPVLFMRVKDGRLFQQMIADSIHSKTISDYPAEIMVLREELQNIRDEHFDKGDPTYQDQCDPAIETIKKLNELIGQLHKDMGTRGSQVTVPLDHVTRQVRDLRTSLNSFRDICPRSTKYWEVEGAPYEAEREVIRSKMDTLLESISLLSTRLSAPTSPAVPANLTPWQRRVLEQKRNDLQKLWHTRNEKAQRINEALVIETDVTTKVKYETQLAQEEAALASYTKELEEIEQKLQ
jgi:hypothetical protein